MNDLKKLNFPSPGSIIAYHSDFSCLVFYCLQTDCLYYRVTQTECKFEDDLKLQIKQNSTN